MDDQTNPFAEAEQVKPPRSHRPTPVLVIAFAMLTMYVIVKASEVWPLVHDVSALLTFAALLLLAKWARSE